MSAEAQAEVKAAAREAALARRAVAHAAAGRDSAAVLRDILSRHVGRAISGYLPIRTEIDPLPAMRAAHEAGSPVAVPVIEARATPLRFRRWQPGCALVKGTFGTSVPETGDWLRPEIVIVPLLAFDAAGGRLGYGGGFYDRTLEILRRGEPVMAIGFAYAGQQADHVPLEPTDQPLDLIVTEAGVIRPGAAGQG